MTLFPSMRLSISLVISIPIFFAPQFTGTYTIDVGDFGNTVDPEVAVYIASTGAQVGYNDDLSAFNDDAHLELNLTADVRYIIAVADQPATTAGNVSIIVTAPFRTGSFLLTPDAFGDATAIGVVRCRYGHRLLFDYSAA